MEEGNLNLEEDSQRYRFSVCLLFAEASPYVFAPFQLPTSEPRLAMTAKGSW